MSLPSWTTRNSRLGLMRDWGESTHEEKLRVTERATYSTYSTTRYFPIVPGTTTDELRAASARRSILLIFSSVGGAKLCMRAMRRSA